MRFYLDEDLSQTIATIARSRGTDIASAQELRRLGVDDPGQLRYAAENGRCLVTRNGSDFRRYTTLFQERGYPHAGVLLIPPSLQGNEFAAIAGAIIAYDHANPNGMPPYMVDYLRVRRT